VNRTQGCLAKVLSRGKLEGLVPLDPALHCAALHEDPALL
jgi:hypothetical protein